jgi:hypothetical protein
VMAAGIHLTSVGLELGTSYARSAGRHALGTVTSEHPN